MGEITTLIISNCSEEDGKLTGTPCHCVSINSLGEVHAAPDKIAFFNHKREGGVVYVRADAGAILSMKVRTSDGAVLSQKHSSTPVSKPPIELKL